MFVKYTARSKGEPASGLDRWFGAHASYDFGVALRVVGFMLKWLFYVVIPLWLAALFIIVGVAGRHALPAWLMTPLLVFSPKNLFVHSYGILVWVFVVMAILHLARTLHRIGRLITLRGHAKLTPNPT